MEQATGSVLAGCRVLVVEDEFYIADDLRRALVRLGAEVVGPVPTEAEALAHLAADVPVDLAVLDINLRGEMAFRTADALAERGIAFVFVSGYDRHMVPARHRQVPHWQKPFEPAALAGILPRLAAD